MSHLSTHLKNFADDLDVFSSVGAVLQPQAIQSIVDFMREAATNAASLERMLERRLSSAEFDKATRGAPNLVTPQNVVPFPALRAPVALGGGDAA